MQKRGRQTRTRLIAAMPRAIRKEGVGRAGIGDILKATGAEKGSRYFHLQDQNDLALTALHEAGADFQGSVAQALSRGSTPEEKLAAFRVPRDMPLERDRLAVSSEPADNLPEKGPRGRLMYQGDGIRL